MAWVDRMQPTDQDEQFESWRKEFQQERLLRIVREREIMKETAKRCKSYKTREKETNDALERKRQAILAERKAGLVQATMRFQRNLPGFTIMDPNQFERTIETITGRQLSNRSTPRRTLINQQRSKPNTTFRRSISMEELGTKQQMSEPPMIQQKHQTTILMRTNSVQQVPQHNSQVQYKSPLQEVQRRVLNDFAAQIQSTLNDQQNFEESNTWERESIDSLEDASHQLYTQQKITGPIVRTNHVVNIQTNKTQPTINNEQQELMRRSYHESFFVKNTPVTGEEQVAAWLGASKNDLSSNNKNNRIEIPSSVDGNDAEINAKRKSILKRSPSVDSDATNSFINTKPSTTQKKPNLPLGRNGNADKVHVKDSLEVINAKLLKELDIQKKTVRFAQDSSNERCASDTQLVQQPVVECEQTSLRRVQSAAMIVPPNPQKTK